MEDCGTDRDRLKIAFGKWVGSINEYHAELLRKIEELERRVSELETSGTGGTDGGAEAVPETAGDEEFFSPVPEEGPVPDPGDSGRKRSAPEEECGMELAGDPETELHAGGSEAGGTAAKESGAWIPEQEADCGGNGGVRMAGGKEEEAMGEEAERSGETEERREAEDTLGEEYPGEIFFEKEEVLGEAGGSEGGTVVSEENGLDAEINADAESEPESVPGRGPDPVFEPEFAVPVSEEAAGKEPKLILDAVKPDWYDWEVDYPAPYIETVSEGISLNDKLVFIGELFRGDEELFRRTLEVIDGMGRFKEVVSYVREHFPEWRQESDEVYRFYMIVRRRFNRPADIK